MKTTKFILLFTLVAIPLLYSCKKEDDNLTNAEKIGEELKTFISDNNIRYVEVRQYYSANTYDYFFSPSFKIEGSFIKVDEYRFYLEDISSYYIGPRSNGETNVDCLFLLFK
ncbi:MAG: hypothetical protein EHM93_11280 [Bacteroidales bacterium]|nr:MAG: hypothetical protein EHM93_11280 [Bacteroidales bacterium]